MHRIVQFTAIGLENPPNEEASATKPPDHNTNSLFANILDIERERYFLLSY